MGQSLTYSITTDSETATSITKRLTVTYNSSASVFDETNTRTISGDWPYFTGSASINIPSGGGAAVIYYTPQTFTKTYGATQEKSFAASLTGIDYWGAGNTIYASGSTTIPARAYDIPAVQTGVVVSRTSDTQHVITWTNNSTGGPTTAAPYQSQHVQRWDNVSGMWATIITGLSGTATTYTDTTTVANRQYKYRVVAVNTTASTTSAGSSPTQTTPATPTGAAAVKSGSNIVVTWVDRHSAGMTVTYTVEESQDGGAWTSKATGIAAGVQTYTHVSPSAAVTHAYRVKAVSTTGVTLSSGYSTSNTVQLAAPPNPPASLAPSGVAVDATEVQTLTWVHSPVDSSAQRKFQIEHRLTGAGSWTTVTAVTSAVSSWTLPASTYANGTSFEWHVRTWGQATTGGSDGTGASVYSATATVPTSARPTATISTPGATVTTSRLALAFAYYDAEGTTQAEWQAELLDAASAVVESAAGVNANTSFTFIEPVADASTYTVRARVRDGSGLWSAWDSRAFAVSYLPPVDVALTAVYGGGFMTLTLTPDGVNPGVTVAATSVAVQRRIDGGDWLTIASSLDPDAVLNDTTCATVGLNEYRTVVTSALPSSATGTPVLVPVADTKWAYLSYGPAFSIILRCYGNLEFGHGDGREVVLTGFENRPKPVAAFDQNRFSTLAFKGDLTADATPLTDWRTAMRDAEIALVRTPAARRDFGVLGGFGANETNPYLTPINFTLTVADFNG